MLVDIKKANFLFKSSIDEFKNKNGEVIYWKQELSQILSMIFPSDVDRIYTELANDFNDCCSKKNNIYTTNKDLESVIQEKNNQKANLNGYKKEIKYLEDQIKQVALEISNSKSISEYTELFSKLQNLYKSFETLNKYDINQKENVRYSMEDYESKKKLFIEAQKLFSKSLSMLLNKIKKLDTLNLANQENQISKISYTDRHKQKLVDLLNKLPLDNERKTMFINLIEEYIKVKKKSLYLTDELCKVLVSNPDLILDKNFFESELYSKFVLVQNLSDAFYLGHGGIVKICTGNVYDDGIDGLKMTKLDPSLKEKISDTINVFYVCNSFFEKGEIDIEKVDNIYQNTTDPILLNATSVLEEVQTKRIANNKVL